MLEIDELTAIATNWARAHGRTLLVVTGDHDSDGLQVEHAELVPALLRVSGSASDLAARLNADRTNIAQVMSEFAGVTDLTTAELAEIKQATDAEDAIGVVLSARVGLRWAARGHTATPVPVYAFGPGAEAFVGAMDNTDIPKRIATVLGLEAASQAAPGRADSRILLWPSLALARAGL
jgi:alkaline phosphatase